ncbi:MAG: hypothetical protein ACRDE2_05160 [Chitinophagaceae bacterium]
MQQYKFVAIKTGEMKRIFILIAAVMIGIPAFSQHIITGTVKDNSGQAVHLLRSAYTEATIPLNW